MTSPAYLNPGACRRRYEAVAARADYPTAALDALIDRLYAAAYRCDAAMARALFDRADTLRAYGSRRAANALRIAYEDRLERDDCAREDAADARRDDEWLESR